MRRRTPPDALPALTETMTFAVDSYFGVIAVGDAGRDAEGDQEHQR